MKRSLTNELLQAREAVKTSEGMGHVRGQWTVQKRFVENNRQNEKNSRQDLNLDF